MKSLKKQDFSGEPLRLSALGNLGNCHEKYLPFLSFLAALFSPEKGTALKIEKCDELDDR
jgi:hypothetical protein